MLLLSLIIWFSCYVRFSSFSESTLLILGLAISEEKKIIPRKTEEMEQLICSGGIPAVPRHSNLVIPFRTVLQRRRMLGILYHETKIEANSRNSVLNHSVKQKTLGIPFRTVPQRRKMLGIPFCEKKWQQTLGIPLRSMSRTRTCCLFCLLKQDFL